MVYLANIRSESVLLAQRKEFGSAAAGFFTRCLLNLYCLNPTFISLLQYKPFQGFALISNGFVGVKNYNTEQASLS